MGESNSMLVKGRSPTEVSQTKGGSTAGEAAVVNMPKSLRIGKSLQGQVVSISGNEIELLLQGNAKIVARMEQNMQVSLNQILNFEVKRTNSSLILRPLFENLGQDANLVKALNVANMPTTTENLEMVQTLMQKGMSINKQTLNELNRQIAQFPKANGEILIEMKELEIPVTEKNISQFIAYKGMNHFVTDSFQELASNLQEAMYEMIETGNDKDSLTMLNKFNQLVSEKQSVIIDAKQNIELEAGLNGNQIKSENEYSSKNSNNNIQNLSSEININSTQEVERELFQNIHSESDQINQGFKEEQSSNLNKIGLEISKNIEQMDVSAQITAKFIAADGDLKEIFNLLEDLMKDNDLMPKLKSIIQSKSFQKGIQGLLEENSLLEPKEFADKEAVKESFERIKQQVDFLNKMSDSIGKTGEQLSNTTTTMQNNLEFMNQLNQTFNYLQLPLKNGENKGHGELFVYAKKKTTIEEGESVSALLHLKMKNLGALDVHVKMDEGKVQTNFFLEDEKSFDFISSHLPELDAAIEDRGYQVNSSASILTGEKDTLEYLIEKEELEGKYLVSNHSFDARA